MSIWNFRGKSALHLATIVFGESFFAQSCMTTECDNEFGEV